MKRMIFAAALLLGASTLMPATALAQFDVNLNIVTTGSAPPPPLYEQAPSPRNGYIWAPGFWNWNGAEHVWNQGHWEQMRLGQRYQPHQWQRTNDGWRLISDQWQNVARQQVPLHNAEPSAPPPPRYEAVPPARPGFFWTPGYWEWRGYRHVWVVGGFKREVAGHRYHPPLWVQRNGHWHQEPSHWEKVRTYQHRDKYQDKHQNKHRRKQHDHEEDDDDHGSRRHDDRQNARNQYDRILYDRNVYDSDRDGISNQRDGYPNDPYRR